nr:mannitol dehydrogenase family protein [Psychromicrobium silvestre]
MSRTALALQGVELPKPPVRIVHLGLGAFHRAHQAWYTQHAADGAQWGIAAFSIRSAAASAALAPQDGLSTLVQRGVEDVFDVLWPVVEVGDGSSAAGRHRIVELLASPETAIVSLTITEAGYQPGSPALELLAEGLLARERAGAEPISLLPCDNLRSNGERLRLVLTDALRAAEPGWLDSGQHHFVSTSVDRITPRTTAADRRTVELATGWEDAAPVVTEEYTSWVLQGIESFPLGRPHWEDAGARFVTDIQPWEQRKLWMLNGAHTFLALAGQLRGHQTVAEAIADPELLAGVRGFWAEVVPQLPVEVEAEAYAEQLLDRFANPRIEHRLAQISQDSVAKLQERVVPVWLAERGQGRSGAAALSIVEAWCRAMLAGVRSVDAADPGIDAALSEPEPRYALLTLVDSEIAKESR